MISLALKWPSLLSTQPRFADLATLHGFRGIASQYLSSLQSQTLLALIWLILLLLLSIVLRKEWLAFGLALLLLTYSFGALGPGGLGFVVAGVAATFLLVVLTRFGLLATVAFIVCNTMIRIYPITADFSAWYAGGTIFVLGVIMALCGYGFYTSLGGQKVFAGKLLEE